MLTFRNVSAVAFFLFGTTFLWMTASFIGNSKVPRGTVWTVINVLALAAILGFTVAAWGVYKQTSWWEAAAVISAVVGLIAVVPYIVGINGEGQLSDQGVVMNIGIHTVGSLIVLAVAIVPVVHNWFVERWS